MGEQEAQGGLIVEGMVNTLCIVKHKIVCEVLQKELRISDGIFMDLDELFRECALVALNATVDPGASGIRPIMEDVLVVEISIEVAFEFRAIVGLDDLDGQGIPTQEFLEEVTAVAVAEAGIG